MEQNEIRWPKTEVFTEDVVARLHVAQHRRRTEVSFEQAAEAVGDILRERRGKDDYLLLWLDFNNSAPGRVAISVAENLTYDDRQVPFDYGEVPELATFLRVAEKLAKAGREPNPMMWGVHIDGWFALLSAEKVKTSISRHEFPELEGRVQ
jgi:hypothetical protein